MVAQLNRLEESQLEMFLVGADRNADSKDSGRARHARIWSLRRTVRERRFDMLQHHVFRLEPLSTS
jgi:hypothetical protein